MYQGKAVNYENYKQHKKDLYCVSLCVYFIIGFTNTETPSLLESTSFYYKYKEIEKNF